MASDKAPASRPRRKRRRKPNQLILYVLLILIAGLLGVIVTLLPDGEAPGASAAVAEAEGESQASDQAAPPVEEETLPGATPAEVTDATETGLADQVTETYPEEESTTSVEIAPGEEAGDLWWLPEPGEAGAAPGVLYLVLDDAGNGLEPLNTFLEFPGPLAVAVLPGLPYSVESAARTAAAGKEIMLHLPMEAVGGANPGTGALTVDLDDSEVLRLIGDNLASVPGAIGVNNHMGSRATSDERIMELLLADLRRRDLFFVDSRTSVDSVAATIAGNIGTPFAERHVFLDNDRSRRAILGSIRKGLELAQHQAAVVMIGHATVSELALVLNEIYPTLVERGYRFGSISDAVRTPALAEALN